MPVIINDQFTNMTIDELKAEKDKMYKRLLEVKNERNFIQQERVVS